MGILTMTRLGKYGVTHPKTGKGRLDYYIDMELNKIRASVREGLRYYTAPVSQSAHAAAIHSSGRSEGMNYLRIPGAAFDAELMPQWLGKGAELLGLKDPTDQQSLDKMFEDLEAVAQGYAPGDPSQKVIGAGGDHMMGWDFTFSPDKSITMELTFGDDETRDFALQTHFEGVKAVMKLFESDITMTRFEANGRVKKNVDGIIAACFHHRAGRSTNGDDWDPQAHTHLLLFNMVRATDPNGKEVWRTIDAKTMYAFKMAAGALYRAYTAKRWAERGYLIRRTGGKKQDTFTLDGFPQQVLDQASKRASSIEALLKAKGLENAHVAQKMLAKLATRNAKDEPPYPELLRHWREVEGNYGWGPEQSRALLEKSLAARAAAPVEPFKLDPVALLERVTYHESVFMESDLIYAIAIESVGHWDIDQILAEAKAIQAHAIPLPVALQQDAYGRKLFTTQEMLDMEKFIQDQVGLGMSDPRHRILERVAREHLRQYERKEGITLKGEQRDAAIKALSDSGTVAIIRGAAGTGKTTVAKGIARTFELNGFNVVGTAISSSATTNLGAEADIEVYNVTDLLTRLGANHHKPRDGRPAKLPITAKTVLFVDESGMVDTRSMHKLMKYQQEIGFKMVWFGDTRQLAPVLAGAPQLTTEHNYPWIVEQMSEITRQKEEPMRQIVLRSMHAHHMAFKINARGEEINSKGLPARDVSEKIPVYRPAILTAEQRATLEKIEAQAVEAYMNQHAKALARLAARQGEAANSKEAQAAKAHARALRPVAAPPAQRKSKVPADPLSAGRINEAIRARLREQGHLGAIDFALIVEKASVGVSSDADVDGNLVRHFAEGERVRFTQPIQSLQIGRHAMGVIRSLREELADDGKSKSLIATMLVDQRGGAEPRLLEINLTEHHDLDYGYCIPQGAAQLASAQARNADVIIEGLDKMGRLHIINPQSEDEIERRLVNDWLDAERDWPGIERGPDGKFEKLLMKDKLMLAGENRSVRKLNEIAREELRARGVLRGPDFYFLRPAESDDDPNDNRIRMVAIGERVVFTAPILKKEVGRRIDNGTRGTIEHLALNEQGELMATIRIDASETDPGGKIVLNLNKYNALDHGYATTIHKAQGRTVEKAFILYSSAMGDSQWFYVAISRARWGSQVYSSAQDIAEIRESLGIEQGIYDKLTKQEQKRINLLVQRKVMSDGVATDGTKHSAIDFPSDDPASIAEGTIPLHDRYEPIVPEGWERPESEASATAPQEAADRELRALAAGEPPVLVAHGEAPFENDPKKRRSYFVTTRDANGDTHTVWGVDLERAVAESGAQIGDAVHVKKAGERLVTIHVTVHDEAGKKVGVEPQEVKRMTWAVRRLSSSTPTQSIYGDDASLPADASYAATGAEAPLHVGESHPHEVAFVEPYSLVAHGSAPYLHNRNNGRSYFVTLLDANGRERTVWGSDLERAVAQSGVRVGDTLGSAKLDQGPIVVHVQWRDGDGALTDTKVGLKPEEILRAAQAMLTPADDEGRNPFKDPSMAIAIDSVGQQPPPGILARDPFGRVVGIEPDELMRVAREAFTRSTAAVALAARLTSAQPSEPTASIAPATVAVHPDAGEANAATAGEAPMLDAVEAVDAEESLDARTDVPSDAERVEATAATGAANDESRQASVLAFDYDKNPELVRAQALDASGARVEATVIVERKELLRAASEALRLQTQAPQLPADAEPSSDELGVQRVRVLNADDAHADEASLTVRARVGEAEGEVVEIVGIERQALLRAAQEALRNPWDKMKATAATTAPALSEQSGPTEVAGPLDMPQVEAKAADATLVPSGAELDTLAADPTDLLDANDPFVQLAESLDWGDGASPSESEAAGADALRHRAPTLDDELGFTTVVDPATWMDRATESIVGWGVPTLREPSLDASDIDEQEPLSSKPRTLDEEIGFTGTVDSEMWMDAMTELLPWDNGANAPKVPSLEEAKARVRAERAAQRAAKRAANALDTPSVEAPGAAAPEVQGETPRAEKPRAIRVISLDEAKREARAVRAAERAERERLREEQAAQARVAEHVRAEEERRAAAAADARRIAEEQAADRARVAAEAKARAEREQAARARGMRR